MKAVPRIYCTDAALYEEMRRIAYEETCRGDHYVTINSIAMDILHGIREPIAQVARSGTDQEEPQTELSSS